jgi:hypothetical protein
VGNWHFLYGDESRVVIPPARRAALEAQLRAMGVGGPAFDLDAWFQDLRRRGRIGFRDDHEAFVPEEMFLE